MKRLALTAALLLSGCFPPKTYEEVVAARAYCNKHGMGLAKLTNEISKPYVTGLRCIDKDGLVYEVPEK